MREVIPNVIWIGNAFDARNVRSVLDGGISAVIDLAIEEAPIQFPRDVTYCRYPLLDGEGNAPETLRSAIDMTATYLKARRPTLVACSGGMSRSPAIVSAALAQVHSIDLETAIERVTAHGPCDFSPGHSSDVVRFPTSVHADIYTPTQPARDSLKRTATHSRLLRITGPSLSGRVTRQRPCPQGG